MNILKRLLILILFCLLTIYFSGCIDVGITTPGIVDNLSTCSIEYFGVSSLKEGEVQLKWQIDGEYDEIILSRRESGGSYETLAILKDCSQDIYIDKIIDLGKIYIYKVEVKSGLYVQDCNKCAFFSSCLESGGVNIIYNINLSDPNIHQYKVEMWISKSYSAPLRFKSESYHPHGSTLHVLNWDYNAYDGISVYGDPDSGIEVNGKGIACIRYEAELPPIIISDIYDILGLYSKRFFLASGVQHLLLVQESDKENIDLIYKIYNTDFNWKVLSPEFSPEDKLFIIDFFDIDGNYFTYQENTVLCYPSGEFLLESSGILPCL